MLKTWVHSWPKYLKCSVRTKRCHRGQFERKQALEKFAISPSLIIFPLKQPCEGNGLLSGKTKIVHNDEFSGNYWTLEEWLNMSSLNCNIYCSRAMKQAELCDSPNQFYWKSKLVGFFYKISSSLALFVCLLKMTN